MLRLVVPRLLIVVICVPPLFAATAFAMAELGRAPEAPANVVGAVSFAALVLAPSHRNAVMRALVLGLTVSVGLIAARMVG